MTPPKTPNKPYKLNVKSNIRKQGDKKVKFVNAKPDTPPSIHDGKVNLIQNETDTKGKDNEVVEGTPVPNDSPSSSQDESKHSYFDLLSSSSDEYESGDNSNDDE